LTQGAAAAIRARSYPRTSTTRRSTPCGSSRSTPSTRPGPATPAPRSTLRRWSTGCTPGTCATIPHTPAAAARTAGSARWWRGRSPDARRPGDRVQHPHHLLAPQQVEHPGLDLAERAARAGREQSPHVHV